MALIRRMRRPFVIAMALTVLASCGRGDGISERSSDASPSQQTSSQGTPAATAATQETGARDACALLPMERVTDAFPDLVVRAPILNKPEGMVGTCNVPVQVPGGDAFNLAVGFDDLPEWAERFERSYSVANDRGGVPIEIGGHRAIWDGAGGNLLLLSDVGIVYIRANGERDRSEQLASIVVEEVKRWTS